MSTASKARQYRKRAAKGLTNRGLVQDIDRGWRYFWGRRGGCPVVSNSQMMAGVMVDCIRGKTYTAAGSAARERSAVKRRAEAGGGNNFGAGNDPALMRSADAG